MHTATKFTQYKKKQKDFTPSSYNSFIKIHSVVLYLIRILQAYGESVLQESFGRDANVLKNLMSVWPCITGIII